MTVPTCFFRTIIFCLGTALVSGLIGLSFALGAFLAGLIVSELISNSFKHAFPPGRSGEIAIRCGIEDGWIRLTVSDTGVGLPSPGLDFRNTETLGLQLVTLLVEQLRGEVEVAGGRGGTVFSITFPGTGPGCRREFVGHCNQ